MVKGFGRRPLRRLGVRRGRRLKAYQGGSRKEDWGLFGERAYGDLRIADGWRARRRRSAIGDRRYSVFSAEAPMVGGFDGDEVRDMLTTGTSSTIAKTTGLSLRRGRRLKAYQGGSRKEDWGLFGERAYGDLRIADGWRARRRRSAIGDRRYSVFSAEAPMVGGFDGDEVRDMLTTGTSVSTIAKTTGLSRQAIYRLKDDPAWGGGVLATWAA